MGACCSSGNHKFEGFIVEGDVDEKEAESEIVGEIPNGDFGAHVRLQGSSKVVSMFTQQGRKGTNQDAMTVWENFLGEKGMFFCGVFDGHGPSGHKVARQVRDILPSILSSSIKELKINRNNDNDDEAHSNVDGKDVHDDKNHHPSFYSSWKASLMNSFKEIDEELQCDASIDSYCSGTTAVVLLKQDNHLIIANLGDSRAVLCTSGDKNQLVPVQLTVDLKPNVPTEAERIRNCKGRVFAMEEEPQVLRVWMPDENCPGLAMARAFGDFCLKDFGLISAPEISYRKLTDTDEFVVLATDGVWDVLTNSEVIEVVASARKRSTAARMLVDRAVRAWRCKYPNSKVDDCAVICLFLKDRPLLISSKSEMNHQGLDQSESELGLPSYSRSLKNDDGLTVINTDIAKDKKELTSVDVAARGNSLVKLPGHEGVLNQRRAVKNARQEEMQARPH